MADFLAVTQADGRLLVVPVSAVVSVLGGAEGAVVAVGSPGLLGTPERVEVTEGAEEIARRLGCVGVPAADSGWRAVVTREHGAMLTCLRTIAGGITADGLSSVMARNCLRELGFGWE